MTAHGLAGRTTTQRIDHIRPFVIDMLEPDTTATDVIQGGFDHVAACDPEIAVVVLAGMLRAAHARLAEIDGLDLRWLLDAARDCPAALLGVDVPR